VTVETTTRLGVPGDGAAAAMPADSAMLATSATSAAPELPELPGMPPEMPPSRPRWQRVQLNTRVRVEVERLLQRFVDDHDTTVQSSVDLALVEFLAARGYPLPASEESIAVD
jgi:hypothetical protein